MHEYEIFLKSLTNAKLRELNQTETGEGLLAFIATNMGDLSIDRLLSSYCMELIKRLREYVGEERFRQYLSLDANIKRLFSSPLVSALIKRLPLYIDEKRLKRYQYLLLTKRQRVQTFSFFLQEQLSTAPSQNNTQPLNLSMS